ncbi:MAG: ATP-dependent helicase [Treponema sp.]|jgi:DNA helicase-2/ATP-dependent DNA helicase PcrA|nr:ATP-dependent helicase [Treponema sp.]
MDYLDSLNPEQRQAVLHDGKSLLILAGAGSGKTRVITTKIAYLIRERGYAPWSILAVTFTNKAAREMAARASRIDERADSAMIRTFHSFGAWFLRRNAALAGLDSGFVIYDDDDAVSLLGTLMEDAPKAELRETAALISRAKDYFLSPEDPELDRVDYRPKFRKTYALYEEKKRKIGNVDFGDLIKIPVEILRNNADVAARFRERFSVIMVDEYQDSNVAQFRLLCELTGGKTCLCVVGDDDQSIYRFRGAEVKNILEFPDRFPGTDIIRLERNYRSFAPILSLASSVVDHNEGRLGKTLRACRTGGNKPTLVFLPDQDEEASFCAELVERSVAGKKSERARYSDWAILYRINAQSLGFETELLRRRIPYRVVGSLKFYEREEIKDALALFALVVNPRDEVAFRRIVNKPARGIGGASVEKIIAVFESEETAPNPAPPDLPADAGTPGPSIRSRKPGDRAGTSETQARFDFDISGDIPGETGAKKPPPERRGGFSGGRNLLESARRAVLPPKAARGVETFAAILDRIRDLLAGNDPADAGAEDGGKPRNGGRAGGAAAGAPPDIRSGEGLSVCAAALIRDSGLAEYHAAHDEINGYQRIANLQELVNAASLYPANTAGLLEFLEHIELDRSIEDNTRSEDFDAVTLITLHNTKGLEFRRVILTGLEQGIFPRNDKEADDLEEERRLFYVGATRAMDELYLCSCALRRMYGRTQPMLPSLFLREADKSSLRIIGAAPAGFLSRPEHSAGGSGEQEGRGSRRGAEYRRNGGKVSSDGRWRLGDRVFHDDQGYGNVAGIEEGEDGPVVKVRFDNGHETRFISAYQSSKFVVIRDED